MRYLLDIKLFSLALGLKIQGINYIPIALGLMETYFSYGFPKIDHWPISGPKQQFQTSWLKVTAVHGALSVPFPAFWSTHCTTLSPTGTLCTLQLHFYSSCPVATNRDAALFQSGHTRKWASEVRTSEYERCDKGSSANKADGCSWRRCALKGSTCQRLRRSACVSGK